MVTVSLLLMMAYCGGGMLRFGKESDSKGNSSKSSYKIYCLLFDTAGDSLRSDSIWYIK